MSYTALIHVEAVGTTDQIAGQIALAISGEVLPVDPGGAVPIASTHGMVWLLDGGEEDGDGRWTLSVRGPQRQGPGGHDAAAAGVYQLLTDATPWALELLGPDDRVLAVRASLDAS